MDQGKTMDRAVGSLLGGAVGDAMGLPFEFLSTRRVAKLFRTPGYQWFFGYGMVTDDTEHAFLTLQSLHEAGGDLDLFHRRLRRYLKAWLFSMPSCIGFGTLRALIKHSLGLPAKYAAVASPGSGPAMRAAVVGCYAAGGPEPIDLDRWVDVSSELTHRDPRALTGARAIARLARLAAACDGMPPSEAVFAQLIDAGDDSHWRELVAKLERSLTQGDSVADFAAVIGFRPRQGGFVYFTVPIAVFSWLRHFGDLEATLAAVIRLGGDTDTCAAMAGALAGASLGLGALPGRALAGLWDYPLGLQRLMKVADHAFAPGTKRRRLSTWFFVALFLRNLVFLTILVGHLVRRLLPPY